MDQSQSGVRHTVDRKTGVEEVRIVCRPLPFGEGQDEIEEFVALDEADQLTDADEMRAHGISTVDG
jgi:hypothetical protein